MSDFFDQTNWQSDPLNLSPKIDWLFPSRILSASLQVEFHETGFRLELFWGDAYQTLDRFVQRDYSELTWRQIKAIESKMVADGCDRKHLLMGVYQYKVLDLIRYFDRHAELVESPPPPRRVQGKLVATMVRPPIVLDD